MTRRKLWNNANVLTPQGLLKGGSLLVGEDGTIVAVGATALDAGDGVPEVDLRGRTVLPGLIDVHVHGGNGCQVMDATRDSLAGMSRYHAAHGTTAFLATTQTDSPEKIEAALRSVSRYMAADDPDASAGAQVLGVHLEGPFLNAARAGAQSREHLIAPQPAMIDQFLQAADGRIRLVTIAPELPGGLEAVARFAREGATVSAGHTDATFAQMEEAVRCGVSHTTHHFNGMRPLHHREPGATGAGLMLPELTIELIADGVHVRAEMIRLAYGLKTADRVCAVTDAMFCAGLPDGAYGDLVMEGGSVYLTDRSSLAGSTLTMIAALRHTLRFTGLTLQEAIPSFTSVPARQSGTFARKGTLEPGKDADFIVVDDDLAIQRTIVRGREVYPRSTEEDAG